MADRRGPGERAGLSTAAVLTGAQALLREGGQGALTMRALATRLQVAPNTLYSHVASKTALVDAVLDEVLGQVDPPSADVDPPGDGLRQMMTSTYDVLLAHPDLVPLYLSRQGARGANAERLGDIMLALLARAGVQGAAAQGARRVLIVYTIGFAAFATRPARDDDDGRPLRADDLTGNFVDGLEWLLTGIEATVPRHRS